MESFTGPNARYNALRPQRKLVRKLLAEAKETLPRLLAAGDA